MSRIPDKYDDLPDEIRGEIQDGMETNKRLVDELSVIIKRYREDAVKYRAGSGIEQEWDEDDESYEGIDDANRGQVNASANLLKGQTLNSGVTQREQGKSSTRSTVFLNITRPYVDAASARVSDMLLPTDDRAWQIKPTPVPDLVMSKGDMRQAIGPDGLPMMRDITAEEMAEPDPTAAPPQPEPIPAQPDPNAPPKPQKPVTMGDLAKQLMEEAAEKAKKAETRIDDWLVETQYHSEMRKVIEDCSRVGTGVLKGPFPVKRKATAVIEKDGSLAIEIKEEIKPASKRIDPRNIYPDPSCGESVHNGAWIFEKDEISEKALRDLVGVPGYMKDQILKAIKEGPGSKYKGDSGASERGDANNTKYEMWHFYGQVGRDQLAACNDSAIEAKDEILYAIVTMVNDRVIKAAVNPLDSGSFPYDVIPWQRRCNMPWGMGVARQIKPAQGMINAGNRNMLDNAAATGGPMLVIDRMKIEPADGSWVFSPRKVYFVKEDLGNRPVTDAIAAINIPSMQEQMMGIIQFALKMAEDTTGLPQIMQGSQGSAPDTVGGMQMLNNNASTVLRRIAKSYDDCITEPHIRRYYEYLMIYGEDDSEKGDFTIDARGSSALVERDLQNQALLQMGQMIANPAFGIDPKKYFEEMCKAQHLDPKRLQYTDEEMEKMAAAPPQPPVPIAVAQINAESREKIAGISAEGEQQGQAPDTSELDRARMELDFKAKEAQLTREHEIKMREMDLQIKQMELEQAKANNLDNAKVDLAKTTMQDATKQKLAQDEIALALELSNASNAHDMVKHEDSLIRDEISTDVTP